MGETPCRAGPLPEEKTTQMSGWRLGALAQHQTPARRSWANSDRQWTRCRVWGSQLLFCCSHPCRKWSTQNTQNIDSLVDYRGQGPTAVWGNLRIALLFYLAWNFPPEFRSSRLHAKCSEGMQSKRKRRLMDESALGPKLFTVWVALSPVKSQENKIPRKE